MVKGRKPDGDGACPRCGSKLLYDGRGMTCLSCSYTRKSPPSEKSILVPRQKRKEK